MSIMNKREGWEEGRGEIFKNEICTFGATKSRPFGRLFEFRVKVELT